MNHAIIEWVKEGLGQPMYLRRVHGPFESREKALEYIRLHNLVYDSCEIIVLKKINHE